LDFQNFKFSTVCGFKKAELHRRAKFETASFLVNEARASSQPRLISSFLSDRL